MVPGMELSFGMQRDLIQFSPSSFQTFMVSSSLSHNRKGLVSQNLSVDGSYRGQILPGEIFTLTPAGLRNTADGQGSTHFWGTL